MQTTQTPFINAIFDKEPLREWSDNDSVVLLGEAARAPCPVMIDWSYPKFKLLKLWGQCDDSLLTVLLTIQAHLPLATTEILHSLEVTFLASNH